MQFVAFAVEPRRDVLLEDVHGEARVDAGLLLRVHVHLPVLQSAHVRDERVDLHHRDDVLSVIHRHRVFLLRDQV